jgi:hypothetical protein
VRVWRTQAACPQRRSSPRFWVALVCQTQLQPEGHNDRRPHAPKLVALIDEADAVDLAYMTFLASTPQSFKASSIRTPYGQIKLRVDVVGIIPS